MAVRPPITQSTYRATRSVRETASILGISTRSAWNAVRRGEIKAFRIGGRVLVPLSEIDRLLRPSSNAEASRHDE